MVGGVALTADAAFNLIPGKAAASAAIKTGAKEAFEFGAKAVAKTMAREASGEIAEKAAKSGASNRALHEQYLDQLRRQMSKPHTTNPELANLMDDLYRPGAKVGSGSTADAVRHELTTGELVGGRTHITKAQEYSASLQDWLKANPTAPGLEHFK